MMVAKEQLSVVRVAHGAAKVHCTSFKAPSEATSKAYVRVVAMHVKAPVRVRLVAIQEGMDRVQLCSFSWEQLGSDGLQNVPEEEVGHRLPADGVEEFAREVDLVLRSKY